MMKTKTFIEKVKELGFEVREYDIDIDVINGNHDSICTVSTMFRFVLDTDWSSFETIEEKTREGLYRLAVEYASTPLEEREEEEKYVYRMNCAVVAQEYLKATKKGVVRFEGDRDFSTNEPYFKSKFTDAEVESYPEVVRELFKICEKIEVTP